MNKAKSKRMIFAYGFDAAGFGPPGDSIEAEAYIIHFVGHTSTQSLEKADGIITPSGIFENFSRTEGMGHTTIWVNSDKHHLAKREKEVVQNIKRGGWIAFLLGSVDNVDNRFQDTDLAKKYLNEIFDVVECVEPNPHVHCKADEFADYMHDFGIARTTFWNPHGDYKPRALATITSEALVAAEVFGKCFFVPLRSVEKNRNVLITLVTKCVEAVLEYKRRNDLYLPGWIEEIEFKTERLVRAEVEEFEQKIAQRREDLSRWQRYKGILSSSGKMLNALVVEILREHFKLDIRSKEEFIEDAMIYAEGKPLFVVEIKGVSGGLKREHVNQVDSHRERLDISPNVAGLLVINDFSDIDGLAVRKAKTFDVQQLAHAEKNNVRILRTTTLLEIMQTLETDKDRGRKLVELCLSGKPLVELPSGKDNPE